MSQALAMARRELRAYFFSPVALIFLGTFLLVTLFTFFWVEAFYSRNVADVRPLFEWLPLLLVFLVGALTMRLWSEEQKLGTIELLLTLPVRIERFVLGKFLAGLALVALALALTLGLPLTVSRMGDLDWGPVLGGYLGALLLAAAYLALGLCISSATDNLIVALIATIGAGGILHAIGSEPVTRFFGNRLGEVLRSLGTSSRFSSVARGVLDPSDLVYYLSLAAFFLVLNVAILRAKRWSRGERSARERRDTALTVGLVGANLLLLNVWLAPLSLPRLDLTASREYTVSPVTRDLVRSLDSPLLIRGYFSAKTHPLLAPFVPRLHDLIREYAALSKGNVRAELLDPKDNPALEEEANQQYGIKSFPFRVSDRYEAGIVNSYFSILVKYGDQFQVLSFDDLIEVSATGEKIDVRLRNPEYDLTRAIKKAVYGFQSIESVFADLEGEARLSAYITPKTLPENFRKLPDSVEKVLKDLEGRSGGKFHWAVVDPSAPESPNLPEELYRKYGIRPFSASFLSQDTFYFHLILTVGGRAYRVVPAESMTEADIRKEIEAAIRRATPGFLKRVGLVKPKPSEPQVPPQYGGRPPEPDLTRALRETLAQGYEVEDVSLESGRVPGDVDVLLLVGPKDLDEKARYAVDQYLMRGGAVAVLSGSHEMYVDSGMYGGGSLNVRKVRSGLEDLLAAWGVRVEDSMVLDSQNVPFPIPVERNLGMMRVREIQLMRYPFFVDVRRPGMDATSPIVAGLPRVTVPWASPVTTLSPKSDESGKRDVTVLLRSSPDSWTTTSAEIQPDFRRFPEQGFAAPAGDRKSHVLAVALKGRFESAFAGRPSPQEPAPPASPPAGATPAPEGDRAGRTIKVSPENARLVVIGSSALVNDQVISLTRQATSEGSADGLRLVQNVLDWAVEDVDLLKIRSRSSFARTLVSMEPGRRAFWEWVNYGIVLLALLAVVAGTVVARRRTRPIPLDPRRPRLTNDDFRPRSDMKEVTA